MTAVDAMYRHRYYGYGWAPPATGQLLAAFQQRPATPGRGTAIAPATPRASSSPVARFVRLVEPFCIRRPQVSGNTVHAVVDGPFWTAAAVAASEICEEESMGLRIEIGVGDKISLSEGRTTATSFIFLDPRK